MGTCQSVNTRAQVPQGHSKRSSRQEEGSKLVLQLEINLSSEPNGDGTKFRAMAPIPFWKILQQEIQLLLLREARRDVGALTPSQRKVTKLSTAQILSARQR